MWSENNFIKYFVIEIIIIYIKDNLRKLSLYVYILLWSIN